MPIYEYLCLHCNGKTEIIWDKFDGGPATVRCKECGREAGKILSTVSHKNKHKGRP